MGMLDTRIGVVLTMTFSTFVVVMVYQYLKGIDESYVEAARMETSSIIKVIWYIVMPTIKPAVLALFLFSFTDSYNMLEQPMFFIKDIRTQKTPIKIIFNTLTLFPLHSPKILLSIDLTTTIYIIINGIMKITAAGKNIFPVSATFDINITRFCFLISLIKNIGCSSIL